MKKENNGFVCEGCGKEIPPASQTSRNHCPNCFLSFHVDLDEPGDRKSPCGGRMIPRSYEYANGECKLYFQCINCGHIHRNKSAVDDTIGDIDMRIQFRQERYAHKLSFKKTQKKG